MESEDFPAPSEGFVLTHFIVAAITSAENWLKTSKPRIAASPETTAMAPHSPTT